MKKTSPASADPEPESNCRVCLEGGKVKLSRSCQQCPRAAEIRKSQLKK